MSRRGITVSHHIILDLHYYILI